VPHKATTGDGDWLTPALADRHDAHTPGSHRFFNDDESTSRKITASPAHTAHDMGTNHDLLSITERVGIFVDAGLRAGI
jgi:hypothetical protein